ncbi:MAG: anaerobic ribonucleoside-triphosphate reductase [Treponema sp.]
MEAEDTSKRTLAEIDADIAATKEALKNVHGSETEVYARIVGYYRAVRNWNKGKREEYDHRKMFSLSDSKEYTISEADNVCECSKAERISRTEQKPVSQENTSSENGKYEFFARRTCPNCPPVKSYITNVPMTGRTIDVDTESGLAEAAKKGVFAAPTVIVYNNNGTEVARAHNVEELTSIFEPAAAEA